MANKGDFCIIGVRDASYNQDTNSVVGEISMLRIRSKNIVSPMF